MNAAHIAAGQRLISHWRAAILVLFAVAMAVVAIMLPPLPQDPAYHMFVDQRAVFGVPNALNVWSNLPFLLVGLLGLRALLRNDVRSNGTAWLVFFAGVTLVSLGSSYYHWMPDNRSLVWDRLPMTVGFMGLLVALCQEYIDGPLVRRALVPAILVGVSSVFYWQQTDDLRFYVWVQFMPLGCIILLMILYESRYTGTYLLGVALTFYGLAKVAEYFDANLFSMLGETVSGHSLKHVLAAAGCFLLLVYLTKRKAISLD